MLVTASSFSELISPSFLIPTAMHFFTLACLFFSIPETLALPVAQVKSFSLAIISFLIPLLPLEWGYRELKWGCCPAWRFLWRTIWWNYFRLRRQSLRKLLGGSALRHNVVDALLKLVTAAWNYSTMYFKGLLAEIGRETRSTLWYLDSYLWYLRPPFRWMTAFNNPEELQSCASYIWYWVNNIAMAYIGYCEYFIIIISKMALLRHFSLSLE